MSKLIKDIEKAVGCTLVEMNFSNKPVSCIEKGQKFPLLIAIPSRRNSAIVLSEDRGRRMQYNVTIQIWADWEEGCNTSDEAFAACDEIEDFKDYLLSIIYLLTDNQKTVGNYNTVGNISITETTNEKTEHRLIGISANVQLTEKCLFNICCNDQLIDSSKLNKSDAKLFPQ